MAEDCLPTEIFEGLLTRKLPLKFNNSTAITGPLLLLNAIDLMLIIDLRLKV